VTHPLLSKVNCQSLISPTEEISRLRGANKALDGKVICLIYLKDYLTISRAQEGIGEDRNWVRGHEL
jgi:hypothetical protein